MGGRGGEGFQKKQDLNSVKICIWRGSFEEVSLEADGNFKKLHKPGRGKGGGGVLRFIILITSIVCSKQKILLRRRRAHFSFMMKFHDEVV